MPRSRNPATYSDVAALLDRAIRSGGARVRPSSRYGTKGLGVTANWLMRVSHLRTLLREAEGHDPYEGWEVLRACPCFGVKCGRPNACEGEWVIIRPVEVQADFIPLGEEVEDPMVEEARQLAAALKAEDL